MISRDSGLVYGYNSPIYLIHFDLANKKSTHTLIRPQGKYLDMVYFQKHNCGYLYDDETQSTIKYDHISKVFKTVMKGQLLLIQGKLLRKDKDENLLYIRTGKKQITIVNALINTTDFTQINVTNPNVNFNDEYFQIQDFCPFSDNKIAVCCNQGLILIYQRSSDQSFILMTSHQLTDQSMQSYSQSVTCASVTLSTHSNQFLITIATKTNQNKLGNLHVLKLDLNIAKPLIVQKNIVDFSEAVYSRDQESFFYEILSYADNSGVNYFYCYQRYGNNKLIVFVLDGGKQIGEKKKLVLEELAQLDLHKGLVGKSQIQYDDGSAWSIDSQNVVKRVCCLSNFRK